MFIPNREELAWAAGFFDGEGTTFCAKNRGRWSRLVVVVGQTDRSVLLRFRQAVGGNFGIIRLEKRDHRGTKDMWRYSVESFEHAQAVIAMLWPFLSTPKRQQAYDAMKLRQTAPGWGKRRGPGAIGGWI